MSIAADRRSQVVLVAGETGGMSPADRATLARLLLERGLEVSCRHAPRPDDPSIAPPAAGVVVESGGESPSRRIIESGGAADPASLAETILREGAPPAAGPAWKPWFPVIDYSRCTNCMQCLSFCLFDVYGVSADQKIQVQNQSNCKTECPACSRVCPEVAIMFPKYRHGPINGEDVKSDDVRREAMKVDISALLGGDIYSMLRDRSVKAKSRFSKERDDDRALKERQNCLVTLKKDLDIPAEVLAALPSPEEIMAKAETARLRAEAALNRRTPEGEA
jgi:NAD-dependent dihydropyrimidine dehydrogenase PreA subunit